MSSRPRGHYQGRRVSILTQHGKERVIAPMLADELGVSLECATGFDTDTLGTFTRDIARYGNQVDAARKKAEKGMELLAFDCGIASEGSFGAAPFGFVPWNFELVIWVDHARAIEVVGQAQGPAHHLHEHLSSREQLETFARKSGFPQHGLVVRPDGENDPRIRKGIADWASLHAAFEAALAQSQASSVFVESDLRAHLNPTRMQMIREATSNLISRIQSECPRCGMPGFWPTQRIPGLRCRDCSSPTAEALAERWCCVAANHFEIRDLGSAGFAEPSRCDACNP